MTAFLIAVSAVSLVIYTLMMANGRRRVQRSSAGTGCTCSFTSDTPIGDGSSFGWFGGGSSSDSVGNCSGDSSGGDCGGGGGDGGGSGGD